MAESSLAMRLLKDGSGIKLLRRVLDIGQPIWAEMYVIVRSSLTTRRKVYMRRSIVSRHIVDVNNALLVPKLLSSQSFVSSLTLCRTC